MPSTFANNLRLENIANGEQSGSWGDTTNKNICSLLVDSITAVTEINITGSSNYVLSANAGTTDQARTAVLRFTGLRSIDCYVTAPAVAKTYIIDNFTDYIDSGKWNVIIRTATGIGAIVPFGKYTVYCDGLDFFVQTGFAAGGVINGNAGTTGNFVAGNDLTVFGTTTLKSTLTGVLVGTEGVVSAVDPGTAGNILLSVAATLPAVGTVWASTNPGTLVNSVSGGTTGLTPATATTGAVVLAGTLAVANGGSGVTTKTGTGSNVLSTSPTLTTPTIVGPTTFDTAPMPTVVGTAPLYMVRAWCRGSTSTIAAAGNVGSVTRNGAGNYNLNFTVAMPPNFTCTWTNANAGASGGYYTIAGGVDFSSPTQLFVGIRAFPCAGTGGAVDVGWTAVIVG